jgi:hypothetical protein
MPSLIPLTRGFTADLHSDAVPSRQRRRHVHKAAVALGVLVAIVLLIQALPENRSPDSKESTKSLPSVAPNPYQWRVYMLNQSAVLAQNAGTSFSFRAEELPFSFESVMFGDFRADVDHRATYYGGCGILVNASGGSALLVLRESAGKFISSVNYLGQALIVFSGETKSVSYPTESTSYSGTDKLIEDWRNGTWSPDDGIVIEHPKNVSMTESVFCFMVFEPSGEILVPELQSLPVIIFLLATVIVGTRSWIRRSPPGE